MTLEGYHGPSQVYLALANGLAIPEVPANPTQEQVARALGWYKETFNDFPFLVDERGISPSFAHAMALVFEQHQPGPTRLRS